MHVSKPQAAWPRACTRSPTLRSLGRHSFIGAHKETHRQGWPFRIILQIRELEGMHRRWARDVPPRAWCLGRLSFAPGATADVKNGATSSAKGRHARAWKKSGLATKQQQNPTVCTQSYININFHVIRVAPWRPHIVASCAPPGRCTGGRMLRRRCTRTHIVVLCREISGFDHSLSSPSSSEHTSMKGSTSPSTFRMSRR